MACNDIVSAILHYKRNIDKISDPPERALKYEDRLLHCINKLYKLPVNVNHLQETGVGRTVNSLRKIEGEKGLGDAAKALVAKWKTMVMLEDEAERMQNLEYSEPSEKDLNRIKLIREAERSQIAKTENNTLETLHCPSTKTKSCENESHENSRKHRHEYLDNSKNKKRKLDSDTEEKHQRESFSSETLDKKKSHRTASDEKDFKVKSKSHSSGTNGSNNSNKTRSNNCDQLIKSSSYRNHDSKEEKKHRDKNSDTKLSSTKKESKKYDSKDKRKPKVYPENDGFDSQSGATFADALGPMVVKKSPKKKNNYTSVVSSPAYSDQSIESISTSKDKKKDMKDMLFVQPKLEPLEPDLVDTLPTPTPYYKPHPSYIPTQEAVRRRVQAEEDALTTIMSNKNTRTKVYSGVKGGLSYVPSLYECCCRVLQQHIDALEYTGGIPFSLLKPVLEGATPSQLYQFEHFNPYIIEDTDDLWKFHVNKEFRSEKRQEYESWRDMYLRCVDEREEKYKAVTANIIQRTIENSVPIRKAKLAYIDVAKPPRNILKKQLKNGTSKPDSSRLLGKNDPEAVRVAAPKQSSTREPAVFKAKPKVAPLMQKTLKSIKMSRFKR